MVPWGSVRDPAHWKANLAFSVLVDRCPGSGDVLPVARMARGAGWMLALERMAFISTLGSPGLQDGYVGKEAAAKAD